MHSAASFGRIGLAIVASSGIVIAQAGQGQTREPKTEASITVNGCLKTGEASTPQTGGFMLTNASVASTPTSWPRGGASAAGATATSGVTTSGTGSGVVGAAGRTAAPSAPSAYVLQGGDDQLRQHVNHQVEITGQLEAPNEATKSTGEPGAGKSGHNTQRLRVVSVKPVADACSMR